MAQGTGDKRFLTKSAKSASAGALLALALVALLLAGCGGDSSSDSGSASTSPSTAASAPTASTDGGPGATKAKAGGSHDTADEAAAQGAPGGQPSGGGESAPASKHGPSVPRPTGEPEPGITPQQRREATVANIVLRTSSAPPASGGPQALPPEFTCDGKNIAPALQWQGVPDGSAELVLFAMNLRPVDGKLFFDWAVAGLGPDLEAIEAGKLPKGAVVGRNGFGKNGYGICPESGEETYMFTLFALPEKLGAAQGFDPSALRREVLGVSRSAGILALSYLRR